jgi:hypothetical protein
MSCIAYRVCVFLLAGALGLTACGGGGGASAVPTAGVQAQGGTTGSNSTLSVSSLRVVQTLRGGTTSSATSISAGLQNAPAAGDVLVAAVGYVGSTTAIAAPSGWTLLETVKTGAIGQSTFYHVVAAGEAGNYSWNSSPASPLTVAVQDVAGENGSNPIAAHVATSAGVGYLAKTGTLTAAGALPLAFMTQFTNGAVATGYASTPSWNGSATLQYGGGNAFVQEALSGPVATSAVSVTESWSGGDNSDQVSELVLLSPGSGAVTAGATSSINVHVVQTARQGTASSATSISASLQSAPGAGDALVAAVGYMGSSTSIAAPSGWTFLETVKTGAIGQSTFYHVVAAGEAGSYSWKSNAASPLTVAVVDLAGVNGSQPIAAHVTTFAGVGYLTTTGTLSANGALPLAFLAQFTNGAVATGYASVPNWNGNATLRYGGGNAFVQEALSGPVATSAVSVTESWSGGDNSDQVSELVLVAPGSSGSGSGVTNGTATPTPVPISPTASSGGGYTYAGCPMFPGTAGGHSGGWYNTDVSAAPVESDSSALIADFTGGGGTSGGFGMIPSAVEVINTPSTVSLAPVTNTAYGVGGAETNSLPAPASVYSGAGAPAPGRLLIEALSGSDAHYNVIATNTCQYWVAGATSWTGSGFNVWNAALYDLNKPQPLAPQYGSTGDCCGLPLAAFLVKPAELKAGVINHAIGWSSPGNEGGLSPVDPARFVPPAVEAQGGASCTTPAPCMPYGAHIRLKASFNDASFPPSAKAVAEALKHYGAYLMDTGCCLIFSYIAQDWSGIDMATVWTSADGAAIGGITMKNMDVIAPANSNAPN